MALASFRTKVQGSPKQHLGRLAASTDARELAHRCIICGFWTPDYTKVKNHLRQAHAAAWTRDGAVSLKMCQSFTPQMIKGHPCPFYHKTVYDKRKHSSSYSRCVLDGSGCTAHMRWETLAPLQSQNRLEDDSSRPATEAGARIVSRPSTEAEVGPSAHIRTMQKCRQHMLCQRYVTVVGSCAE